VSARPDAMSALETAAIDAALVRATENGELPFMAHARDHPDSASLRRADERARDKNREWLRDVIAAYHERLAGDVDRAIDLRVFCLRCDELSADLGVPRDTEHDFVAVSDVRAAASLPPGVYEGEVCADCRRPVRERVGGYWRAPDDLWAEVVGDDSTILCPRCFGQRADARGVFVHWEARREPVPASIEVSARAPRALKELLVEAAEAERDPCDDASEARAALFEAVAGELHARDLERAEAGPLGRVVLLAMPVDRARAVYDLLSQAPAGEVAHAANDLWDSIVQKRGRS
jgi:hypothetical protein